MPSMILVVCDNNNCIRALTVYDGEVSAALYDYGWFEFGDIKVCPDCVGVKRIKQDEKMSDLIEKLDR